VKSGRNESPVTDLRRMSNDFKEELKEELENIQRQFKEY
jgi:hypothetical protein